PPATALLAALRLALGRSLLAATAVAPLLAFAVAHGAVRDAEPELASRAGLAAAGGTTLGMAQLGTLDLAAGPLALRDARAGADLDARRLALACGRDQREVDPPAQDRDVVDLDHHLVAELDGLATALARQPHVDLVVLHRLAERVELDQTLDVGLLDLDECTEACDRGHRAFEPLPDLIAHDVRAVQRDCFALR